MGPNEATAASGSSATPPNPAAVRTCEQLAQALKALAGTRGPQGIETAAGKLKPPESLAKSTVSDMFIRGRPSERTLAVFLRVCGVSRDRHEAWQAARRRAVGEDGEPDLARLVDLLPAGDADPVADLGVHAAIDVPGAAGDLPVYVERDTDTDPAGVRALIRNAVAGGQGRLLLLDRRCLLSGLGRRPWRSRPVRRFAGG
ncbi:hypothetical protein [Nonomuraea insulae]|uniref:Uncharacterized protein n=1 Tax=Nonomuraea insulae TaxID=1616787 RepID=A0ABW1CQB9_9ACTN